MPAAFWRALDRLGALGSACSDWRRLLGADWETSRRFLRELPAPADTMTHPYDASIRLAVEPDGADGFIAVRDDGSPTGDAHRPERDEITLLVPDWDAISAALADQLGFAFNRYETQGLTRQIGTAHRSGDPVRPVVLCLPGGHFGDHGRMLADLAARREATILLTAARWLTLQIQTIGTANGLTFRDLHSESSLGGAAPPDLAAPRVSPGVAKRIKPLMPILSGWSWKMVLVEVAPAGRVVFRCDGQSEDYRFPKSKKKTHADGYEILMRLAADPEWRNPPSGASDHDVVRKRLQRLAKRLTQLLTMPDKPFRLRNGVFEPVFRVAFHRSIDPIISAIDAHLDESAQETEWRRLELEDFNRSH